MKSEKQLQIAVVTGASSGMGRETVIQLADRFALLDEIWVLARREDRLRDLERQVPVKLRIFAVDLLNLQELDPFQEELSRLKPNVRFLVNAAGFGKTGPVGQTSFYEETGMVALNCQALCAVTHMVLPFLAKGARVIQFASAAAFLPQPDFADYAASKAFVLSYSRALNRELKPKYIKVTAVCPGPVKTEFFQAMGEGKDLKGYPFYKRLIMAKPEKVVKKAIEDSILRKSVSVYGVFVKAFWLFSKAVPHEWILSVLDRINGRKGAEE